MAYVEIKEMIRQAIAEGKPLHGWLREIAIDLELDELEKA